MNSYFFGQKSPYVHNKLQAVGNVSFPMEYMVYINVLVTGIFVIFLLISYLSITWILILSDTCIHIISIFSKSFDSLLTFVKMAMISMATHTFSLLCSQICPSFPLQLQGSYFAEQVLFHPQDCKNILYFLDYKNILFLPFISSNSSRTYFHRWYNIEIYIY